MNDQKTMTRKEKRLARVVALQTQYACVMSDNDPGIILDHLAQEEDSGITADILDYSGKLVRLVLKYHEFADEQIVMRSNNWEINRITLMDRMILRQAIIEMIYIDEVPPKVSITEAVEIAKIFSTDDSSSFVNGILDSIYNDNMKGKIERPK